MEENETSALPFTKLSQNGSKTLKTLNFLKENIGENLLEPWDRQRFPGRT